MIFIESFRPILDRDSLSLSNLELKSIQPIIRKISHLVILVLLLFLAGCQHAKIRIDPELPQECKPWVEKKDKEDCVESWKSLREKSDSIPTIEKEFEQEYFYWGFSPKDIALDLNNECPKGIVEIYQFSSFKNAVYEQLTLGYYSPRILRLTCLTEELKPEKRSTGIRKK